MPDPVEKTSKIRQNEITKSGTTGAMRAKPKRTVGPSCMCWRYQNYISPTQTLKTFKVIQNQRGRNLQFEACSLPSHDANYAFQGQASKLALKVQSSLQTREWELKGLDVWDLPGRWGISGLSQGCQNSPKLTLEFRKEDKINAENLKIEGNCIEIICKSETDKTKALTSPSDNAVKGLAPELGFVLWIRWKMTCNVPPAPLVLCFSASIAKEPGQQPLSRWRGWIAKDLEIPNHNLDTPGKPFQQHRNSKRSPCTSHQRSHRRMQIWTSWSSELNGIVVRVEGIERTDSRCPPEQNMAVLVLIRLSNLLMNSPSVDPHKVSNPLPNVLDELDIHRALLDLTGPKMWIHTTQTLLIFWKRV